MVFSVTDFGLKDHILYVDESDEFFSEALLYSPFLAKKGQKSFAETHTHADGAIGNFTIGNDKSKGSLHLIGNKLNVFEAKINSEFSKNVSNAPFYDQVSRYIACIAETINNEYWDSKKAMLLYPSSISVEIYDEQRNQFIGKNHSCSLGKISIFKEKNLNSDVGLEVLNWFSKKK